MVLGLICGAVPLGIPKQVTIQLSLEELERRAVVLAAGHRRTGSHGGSVGDLDLMLRPQRQSVAMRSRVGIGQVGRGSTAVGPG